MQENMHIFIWKATSERPARAEPFHNQEEAWASISDTKVRHWPDFIIEFNGDPTENSNFVMKPMAFVEQMMS